MSYVIAGRAIKNEASRRGLHAGKRAALQELALGTFAITGAIAALSMGGKKADKSAVPAISTGNSDEEKYIKDFIANMEKEASSAKEAIKDAVKH
ncbi:hypothetical protein P389DRAFT_198885 [Cystobasidium minutum MCA 4210]|uniref:uncharacterized protein n=1 Tax=Cystobasidium minutum MCA 4210 TaxID=1397322 RepID=UPI0034CD3617|eukprot:jgi/Rhomi1/198885/gm1.7099_g